MADILPPPRAYAEATCQTCADITQTSRYCAPGRCYCGHDTCPAFATYIDPWAAPYRDGETKPNRHAQSWANREGATWIDSL